MVLEFSEMERSYKSMVWRQVHDWKLQLEVVQAPCTTTMMDLCVMNELQIGDCKFYLTL